MTDFVVAVLLAIGGPITFVELRWRLFNRWSRNPRPRQRNPHPLCYRCGYSGCVILGMPCSWMLWVRRMPWKLRPRAVVCVECNGWGAFYEGGGLMPRLGAVESLSLEVVATQLLDNEAEDDRDLLERADCRKRGNGHEEHEP